MADRDRPYMQFNFLVSIGDGTDPATVAAGWPFSSMSLRSIVTPPSSPALSRPGGQ